jgi:hypothetical protein
MKSIYKKGIVCGLVLLVIGLSHTAYATVTAEPVLDVTIQQWFGIFFVPFEVENTGDATAHNVRLANIEFEGQVLYNYRPMMIEDALEPGDNDFSSTYIFAGLGRFVVNITVTCDEGVSGTASANGFALGLFCFIP